MVSTNFPIFVGALKAPAGGTEEELKQLFET